MTTSRPLAPRVLVVEDEPFIAFLVADQLAELGYTIVGPAFSLDEARRFAATGQIDLAVLDFELAGVFADDIADILIRRKIPFLFVTGHDKSSFPAYCDIPFLKKPFLSSALQNAIEALRAQNERDCGEGPSKIHV